MTLAYRGTMTKDATLAQLRAHREADEIVQGVYWTHGATGPRGCAVGCLTHTPGGGHDQFPARWGIPEQLAYLADAIFEALPIDQAKDWPLRFMAAIPERADLSGVWDRFALWLLTDPKHGVARVAGENRAVVEAIAALFERVVEGDDPALSEWSEAAEAARAAWGAWGAWAAWAAWGAWAAEAAEAAEAAWAAWAAARSPRWSRCPARFVALGSSRSPLGPRWPRSSSRREPTTRPSPR